MPDIDDVMLVCLPAKGVPKPPVPGGVKRLCVRCGAQVWLAPSGMRIQREQAAVLLCIPCWWRDTDLAGKTPSLTEEQVREVRAEGMTDLDIARAQSFIEGLKP